MPENTRAAFDAEELRELIAEVLELPADEITDDARFKEDLEVDSLISLELAVRLEERYGVKVDEEAIAELGSFRKVSELVRERLATGATA
ncbi:MAG TPA: acyl carrier protein [Streptomyces sp.]|nr:acyl carrier protein [Streptomyces sp.]